MKRPLYVLVIPIVCAALGLTGCALIDQVTPFGGDATSPSGKAAPADSDANRGQYTAGQVIGT